MSGGKKTLIIALLVVAVLAAFMIYNESSNDSTIALRTHDKFKGKKSAHHSHPHKSTGKGHKMTHFDGEGEDGEAASTEGEDGEAHGEDHGDGEHGEHGGEEGGKRDPCDAGMEACY